MIADPAEAVELGQIAPRTRAEGPGLRFAIWVRGCPLRCPGCCNPELLGFAPPRPADPQPSSWSEVRVSTEALAQRVLAEPGLDGVSLLGGEPFAQAPALARLADRLSAAGLSVMVYTGYRIDELREMAAAGTPGVGLLLGRCDLLVDGRYERTLPERKRRWIGSRNQIVHFLTGRHDPADPSWLAPNTVELRLEDGALVVNGWPELARRLVARRP